MALPYYVNPKLETDGYKLEPLTPQKGLKGGNCNRTACQKPGAQFFNHSTKKYYCQTCAMLINRANHNDAMAMLGHALCTYEA